MTGKLQKQINPKIAALVILIVLVVVQWVWWRGLVYRPPGKPPGPGGGGGGGAAPKRIAGQKEVEVETFAGALDPGDTDGPGYGARLDSPTGLAIDAQGNLYVADTRN